MITVVKADEQNRTHGDASREESGAHLVSAPSCHKVHGQKNESHPVKNGWPISDESENGREHDLEKGHVVVKNIPVLHESPGPCPDYMHVLRFIAIEPVADHVHEPERDHEGEQARCRDKFGAGHPQIICTAPDP